MTTIVWALAYIVMAFYTIMFLKTWPRFSEAGEKTIATIGFIALIALVYVLAKAFDYLITLAQGAL